MQMKFEVPVCCVFEFTRVHSHTHRSRRENACVIMYGELLYLSVRINMDAAANCFPNTIGVGAIHNEWDIGGQNCGQNQS